MTNIVRLHHESKFAKLYEGVTALGKQVAIKAYRSSIRDNTRLRDRLYASVRDAAAHPHDHLLDYIDIDLEQGWIVAEWMHSTIHGLCASDRGVHAAAAPMAAGGRPSASRASLPPDVALTCLQQALSALKFLNDLGRFHGNLKPNNLLTDVTGNLCLSDPFMLAVDDPGVIPSVGTAKYLAPEMTGTLASTPGPGMDLYALGISLIELMSGDRFTESMTGINGRTPDDDMVWLRWHGDLEARLPPVNELVPGCRDDLSQVLDRMVIKDPHQRYRFASQVLQDLAVFSASVSNPNRANQDNFAGNRSGHSGSPDSPERTGPRENIGSQQVASTQNRSAVEPKSVRRPAGKSQSTPTGSRDDQRVATASDVMDRPDENLVIAFASGIRAGEMIGLDSYRFDVGFENDCTIMLENEDSDASPDTRVRVSQSSSGWSAELVSGTGAFINQSLIRSSVPLRSGDFIRMSHDGPDIQFFLQSGQPSIKRLAADYLTPRPRPTKAPKTSAAKKPAAHRSQPAAGNNAARSPNPSAPMPPGSTSPRPVSRPVSPGAAPQRTAPQGPAPQGAAPSGSRPLAPVSPAPNPKVANPSGAMPPAARPAVAAYRSPSGDEDASRRTMVLDRNSSDPPSDPRAAAGPKAVAGPFGGVRSNAPAPPSPAQPSNSAAPRRPTAHPSASQPSRSQSGAAPTESDPSLRGIVWTDPKTWDKATKDKVMIGAAVVVAILLVIFFPTGGDATNSPDTDKQNVESVESEASE